MDESDPVSERGEASGDEFGTTETCDCCGGSGEDDFEYYATKVQLESESALIDPDDEDTVLEARLPEDLQAAAERFLGGVSVETLGDWAREVRDRAGGGPIEIEDLCHESDETGHWGEVGGQRYHFTCFYDAVVLAALTDREVAVRTESPDGTVVEATATGDGDLTVDPPGTLVSFGITTEPGAIPDGEPTHEDVYASVCPVVRAFPTPQAYKRWTERVPAATVAMPLEDATELTAALVE